MMPPRRIPLPLSGAEPAASRPVWRARLRLRGSADLGRQEPDSRPQLRVPSRRLPPPLAWPFRYSRTRPAIPYERTLPTTSRTFGREYPRTRHPLARTRARAQDTRRDYPSRESERCCSGARDARSGRDGGVLRAVHALSLSPGRDASRSGRKAAWITRLVAAPRQRLRTSACGAGPGAPRVGRRAPPSPPA
jgi:hypothetical protein